MNCPDCETVILDSADCRNTTAAVQAHLADCRSCRAFYESQEARHRLLSGSLADVHLSEEFQARLHRRIQVNRSLDRVWRAISFLEFVGYLLLAGAVVFLSAGLTQLPWLDPRLYLPAITVSAGVMIVREFVSGETASD